MNRSILILLFFISSVIFMLSCDQKPPVSKAAASKPYQSAAKTVEVKEEQKQEEVFIYDKKGRKDPFVSLAIKSEEKPKKGQTPLESYDVASIKILGIVWNQKGNFASIVLPDGKAYTLREGMTIGLHNGKVQKITKNAVIIREQIKDYKGVLKPKETTLKLRDEEE
ncbi:MAG: pilus assembly protein PilP [Nitrospiraceae bacterium]|nr:pilus assembly protein PilP [Nitrospiraceae bacterium]